MYLRSKAVLDRRQKMALGFKLLCLQEDESCKDDYTLEVIILKVSFQMYLSQASAALYIFTLIQRYVLETEAYVEFESFVADLWFRPESVVKILPVLK
jgi:hypothetical protein